MDFFRLKVFQSAARTLRFSKSAEVMHVSQPAVSRHISELETAFGTALFVRSASGVELTAAGRLLLAHADALLQAVGRMEADMRDIVGSEQGRLRIGASTTIATYVLPSVLAAFMERFKGVEISMCSANSGQVESMIKDGRIDIGFVESLSRRPLLHYTHLMDDELVLVTASAGAFGGLESVQAADLPSFPLVSRESGSGTREIIVARLSQAGVAWENLDVVMTLDSSEAMKSFLKNSSCLAIMPVVAIRRELADGSLRIIDLDGVDLSREFASVTRPGEFSGLNEKFHNFAASMKKTV